MFHHCSSNFFCKPCWAQWVLLHENRLYVKSHRPYFWTKHAVYTPETSCLVTKASLHVSEEYYWWRVRTTCVQQLNSRQNPRDPMAHNKKEYKKQQLQWNDTAEIVLKNDWLQIDISWTNLPHISSSRSFSPGGWWSPKLFSYWAPSLSSLAEP